MMLLNVGDQIPDSKYQIKIEGAVGIYGTAEYFANKKVVMFSLPGAFTPTCTKKHVPGYLENYEALKSKGVDKVAYLSVNDAHVIKAWGEELNTQEKIDLLSDPQGEFSKTLGLLKDHGKMLGERARRSALIAENGVIKHIFLEKKGSFKLSTAEHILKHL